MGLLAGERVCRTRLVCHAEQILHGRHQMAAQLCGWLGCTSTLTGLESQNLCTRNIMSDNAFGPAVRLARSGTS